MSNEQQLEIDSPAPEQPTLVSRPYQVEAKDCIYKSLARFRSSLCVMPTGTGKTVVFSTVVADGVRRGRRVLIIAHREELIQQGAQKIAAIAGCEVGIEMAAQRDGSRGNAPVLMASVQTLVHRLESFEPDFFHLIIIDEAHHATAPTYRKIVEHFSSAKLLGFTATPNRGDNVALRAVFEDVAYDLPILDAIEGGWLVPIEQEIIETSIDLSEVRRSRGDFTKKDVERVMSSIDALDEIAVPTVERTGERQAIVFAVTVDHAHLLAEAIRKAIHARGGIPRVAVVTGTTPNDERRSIFDGFRQGPHVVQYLVNVEVATEGTDLPSASVIVMARPTLSRALYTQMLGRGTRPLPGVVDSVDAASLVARIKAGEFNLDDQRVAAAVARESSALKRGSDSAARRLSIALSAKPHMLLIDFAANSGRHQLASALDALEGDALDEGLSREVREIVRNGERDLIEAIRLARLRRAEKTRKLRARGGDPFALWGLPDPEPDRWGRPMTPGQADVIARAGMPTTGLDMRQASALISAMTDRGRRRLATYKQCRALHKYGCPLDLLEGMTLKRATELMDILVQSHYRPRQYWWAAPPSGIKAGA